MTLQLSNAFITRHENIHTKITPPHYKTTLGKAHAHTVKITSSRIVWSLLWKGKDQFWVDHLYLQAIKHLRIKTTAWEGEERRYHGTIPTQILHFKVAQTTLMNTTHNLFSVRFLSFNSFFRSAEIFLSEACFFAWGPSWFDPSPLVSPLATFGPCK